MPESIVVIGSGYQAFREYVLKGLSQEYDVVLVGRAEPDWQRPYVRDHRVADLGDPEAVAAAVADLAARHGVRGVLTWEEKLLETTSQVAERLGLPALPASAARIARDKALQRELFAERGVPSARFRVVTEAEEARAFAAEVGYPVVVKPRGQAASTGVQIVQAERELGAAVRFATESEVPGRSGGVLVEEFLSGQEISVDCRCVDGVVEPYVIALKQIGFAPYCEEIGHIAGDVLDPDLRAEVVDVVVRANLALGVDHALTHTEVMLTPTGPRIVEVNARLGGELIPWLAELVRPGLDVGKMLGDVTLGRPGDPLPPLSRSLGIRFLYPEEDLVLDGLAWSEELLDAEWLVVSEQVRRAGEELRLPPRAFLDRAGYGVVEGDSVDTIRARMELASAGCRISGRPLPSARVAS